MWPAVGAVGLGLTVWLLTFVERGPSSTIRNPAPPQPLPYLGLAGLSDRQWIPILLWLTVALCVGIGVWLLRHYRRTGQSHPAWPLLLGLTSIVPLDPVFNWAMYVVYNPRLAHWPVTWEWMNVSPTVEPLWVMGAYPFFFLSSALVFFAVYRRFVARWASDRPWACRHPLLAIFLCTLPMAVLFDVAAELWMINIGIWQYFQIAGPALVVGRAALPLTEIAWASVTISFVTTLLHRDDQGRSTCARLSSRLKTRGLRVGERTTALLLIDLVFVAYIGFFAGLRLSGLAADVNNAYHFPTIKTYDPSGEAEEAGIPGPYFQGTWPYP